MLQRLRGAVVVLALALSSCTNPKAGTPDDGGLAGEDALAQEAGDDTGTAGDVMGPGPADGPGRDGDVRSDLPPPIDLAPPTDDAADAPAVAIDSPVDTPVTPPADGPPGTGSNGSPCTSGGQCATGYCADGVCCGSACAAGCQACTLAKTGKPDGTCAPIAAATDPDGECPAQAAACGNVGGCDGAGACRKQPTTVSCAAAVCAGSSFTPERRCDGLGQCAPAQATSCGLFRCNATGCPASCGGDGDCLPGSPCVGGACGGKRANGAACTRTDECGSGYCVDGVCCGSACNGPCEACSQAKTGQADGTCQAVRSGQDPDSECTEEAASTCGKDGYCDGARNCRKHGVSVMCATATCSVSTFTPARTCDGGGNCGAPAPVGCGLARCTVTGCIAPCGGNQDCVSPAICSQGTCVSGKPQGAMCTAGGECSSGNCVDNFCCDLPCTGPCSACAQAKTGAASGTCAPITAGTDPDTECPDDGTTSCQRDGTCNGMGACRKYDTQTSCAPGSCTGSTAYRPRMCDGMGTCSPPTMVTCTSNQYCLNGYCNPKIPTGQSCTGPAAGGTCQDGYCVDGICCADACTTPCRSCTSFTGMCTTNIDRARDVGACEGENWCVAGLCGWAVHFQDGPGNRITSYSPPTDVKVGASSSSFHYVANGNSGIGMATPTSNLLLTKAGEITINANGCNGAVLAGGQRCQMDIWLTPTSPGMKIATLTATDGQSGHVVSLTFTYNAIP